MGEERDETLWAPIDRDRLRELIDKDRIRELAQLYCRAIDRQDIDLLRSLYTADATDTHGDSFDGGAGDYCDFIARPFPYMPYSGHHICNHLVSIDGDTGEGEIGAIACHVVPDGRGGWQEDIRWVRYIDHYRREADGCWRFARRVVTCDHGSRRPLDPGDIAARRADPGHALLASRLFARGPQQARRDT